MQTIFAGNPTPASVPDALKSSVSAADFRQFVSALEGKTVGIRRLAGANTGSHEDDSNIKGIHALTHCPVGKGVNG
jgi:hypothetical protein